MTFQSASFQQAREARFQTIFAAYNFVDLLIVTDRYSSPLASTPRRLLLRGVGRWPRREPHMLLIVFARGNFALRSAV